MSTEDQHSYDWPPFEEPKKPLNPKFKKSAADKAKEKEAAEKKDKALREAQRMQREKEKKLRDQRRGEERRRAEQARIAEEEKRRIDEERRRVLDHYDSEENGSGLRHNNLEITPAERAQMDAEFKKQLAEAAESRKKIGSEIAEIGRQRRSNTPQRTLTHDSSIPLPTTTPEATQRQATNWAEESSAIDERENHDDANSESTDEYQLQNEEEEEAHQKRKKIIPKRATSVKQ